VSDRFAWDPLAIREILRKLGFDVDLLDAWSGGVVRARRERGDRAALLVLDAAGRLRAELSATLGETARDANANGTALRVVATTQRLVTVTGVVPSLADLTAVIAALDATAEPDLPPSTTAADIPDGPPPP
jgi:hypothetical protein